MQLRTLKSIVPWINDFTSSNFIDKDGNDLPIMPDTFKEYKGKYPNGYYMDFMAINKPSSVFKRFERIRDLIEKDQEIDEKIESIYFRIKNIIETASETDKKRASCHFVCCYIMIFLRDLDNNLFTKNSSIFKSCNVLDRLINRYDIVYHSTHRK